MVIQKVLSYAERLEDPRHPLLGPTLKGLYLIGLWQTGPKLRTIAYNCVILFTFVFVFCEVVDLYQVRHDLNLVLNNISLTVLSVICTTKSASYLVNQEDWKELVNQISREELKHKMQQDKTTIKLMEEYTIYTRIVTFLYWIMVFMTNFLLIVSPFLKYLSKSYRDDVANGVEPLPQILFNWFPFDNKKMPGYAVGVVLHIFMGCLGSAIIAVFDMNAVAIMSYLKGQAAILRAKCRTIFDGESLREVVERIRECHEHHNVLVK